MTTWETFQEIHKEVDPLIEKRRMEHQAMHNSFSRGGEARAYMAEKPRSSASLNGRKVPHKRKFE